MEHFIKETPMLYQFLAEAALIIIGAAIALPGGKKAGWVILALGIVGIYFTLRIRGLLNF